MLKFLKAHQNHIVEDPPFVKFLFTDTRMSVLWLAVRVWLGMQWINSAAGKIGVPGWTENGTALQGYWQHAVAIPETGAPRSRSTGIAVSFRACWTPKPTHGSPSWWRMASC